MSPTVATAIRGTAANAELCPLEETAVYVPDNYHRPARAHPPSAVTRRRGVGATRPTPAAGAPWDVLAYARQHRTLPCDSTLEQLYDATEFEAYQQLGAATVQDAAGHRIPPFMPPVPGIPPIASHNGNNNQSISRSRYAR
jgi:hypothetical protein